MEEFDLSKLKSKKGFDVQEFDFAESEIELVEIKNYSTPQKENIKILIQSKILKENTKIRGSLFIKLFRDDSNELCYSESPTSVSAKVLKYFKVTKFEELIGKPCKIVVAPRDNGQKDLRIYFQ